MTCNAPININTNKTKDDSNGIALDYTDGDVNVKIPIGKPMIMKYVSNVTNNIKYKDTTYLLHDVRIYKPSIHTINGQSSAAEIVITHINTATNASVCICIPVSITTSNNSTLKPLFTKFPNLIYDYKSLKRWIPGGTFYSYTALPFFKCTTDVKNEYIVFTSSSVTISSAELQKVPGHTYKLSPTNITVYKHSSQSAQGKTISHKNDDIYIDCQPIDAPETTTTTTPPPSSSQKSISFSQMKDNKFIQLFVMFLVFTIVMVIFFYSYEFTIGMFRELTRSVSKMNPIK
jgi:hypothetical protein